MLMLAQSENVNDLFLIYPNIKINGIHHQKNKQ